VTGATPRGQVLRHGDRCYATGTGDRCYATGTGNREQGRGFGQLYFSLLTAVPGIMKYRY